MAGQHPIKEYPMEQTIQFRLNGRPTRLTVDGDRLLLWVLRTELGLTGTKYGCGISLCGACTVIVNKEAVRSCQIPMKEVQGREVITIEGLSQGGNLHPLQKAFLQRAGFQCGFCTSGMIMNAYALLLKNPKPTKAEIVDAMENNLCRCGSHLRVIQSIQTAVAETKGGRP
jgi:aerobic-type carbon monoxide dehydrogenase small subunit (CoxS/CutS family)